VSKVTIQIIHIVSICKDLPPQDCNRPRMVELGYYVLLYFFRRRFNFLFHIF